MIVRKATVHEEAAVNALAKLSPYTRDFANPPMSLKTYRRAAFVQSEVLLARHDGVVAGFIWAHPMIAKHMPFSTVYYMGVHPQFQRCDLGEHLLITALRYARNHTIELTCEHGNVAATAFYRDRMKMTPVRDGVVGKDNRPYTRWRLT